MSHVMTTDEQYEALTGQKLDRSKCLLCQTKPCRCAELTDEAEALMQGFAPEPA